MGLCGRHLTCTLATNMEVWNEIFLDFYEISVVKENLRPLIIYQINDYELHTKLIVYRITNMKLSYPTVNRRKNG